MNPELEQRTPAEVFAPGEFISEEIESRGWTQIELAEVLGRPARLISELIAGKRSITPETAKGLGAAFGTGPELWMNLDRDYRLAHAVHDDTTVERRARLYAKAPVKEMTKRGWIEPSENIDVLEKRVLDFLQIENLDAEPWLAHAAKKGKANREAQGTRRPQSKPGTHELVVAAGTRFCASYSEVTSSQWAWLFRVKQLAKSLSVPKYSRAALLKAIASLEPLLIAPEEVRNVPGILAGCGVRFLIVEKLPQADIDGACCWLDRHSPVIGMTLRRDKIDNFWFVLRHELEHVLCGHGQDQAVIDDLDGDRAGTGSGLPEEERIANSAASNFCASSERLTKFMELKHPFYYERDVQAFAKTIGRHPGLVVGQMQFRLGNYSYLAKHLAKVRNFILQEAIFDGWGQVPSLPKAERPS